MKTAVVTGGARGIGRAAAELLASRGYQVAVNYAHSEKEAESLCAALNVRGLSALRFKADVCDTAQVEEMFAAVNRRFGGVDALINNAGVSLDALVTDTDDEAFSRLMDTNMRGTFNCCRAALRYMIAAKSGAIINIASMWGLSGASCEAVYSASKAAVIGFTKALAKEVGPSGIRVNAVAPGFIETDMTRGYDAETKARFAQDTPLMRLGAPEDVARAAAFLCGGEASFITGQILSVDGGYGI